MSEDLFIQELKKINIEITNKTLELLNKYYELLIEYNKHMNLTGITEKKEVYLKHFYDSLTIAKVVNLSNQRILDIGTGAGFPGMVLKIVFKDLDITLVDSLNKRIKFLEVVKKELNLDKLHLYHARAEEFILNNREKYDIVTSRAVAKLNILIEYSIPYLKKEGLFIAMKSMVENELKDSSFALKTLGSVLIKTIEFKLPVEDSLRTLIVIQKKEKNSVKYPRKFNEIKRKPL